MASTAADLQLLGFMEGLDQRCTTPSERTQNRISVLGVAAVGAKSMGSMAKN